MEKRKKKHISKLKDFCSFLPVSYTIYEIIREGLFLESLFPAMRLKISYVRFRY